MPYPPPLSSAVRPRRPTHAALLGRLGQWFPGPAPSPPSPPSSFALWSWAKTHLNSLTRHLTGPEPSRHVRRVFVPPSQVSWQRIHTLTHQRQQRSHAACCGPAISSPSNEHWFLRGLIRAPQRRLFPEQPVHPEPRRGQRVAAGPPPAGDAPAALEPPRHSSRGTSPTGA